VWLGDQGATGLTGDTGPIGDQGPVGDQGPEGDQGAPGIGGSINFTVLNVSNLWTPVDGESRTFEATLSCLAGALAMSVGVNGTGAMNNVVAMAITGANDSGYYRIRIKAGSSPSEVEAQLACGTFS
jgi:hypothetical protein